MSGLPITGRPPLRRLELVERIQVVSRSALKNMEGASSCVFLEPGFKGCPREGRASEAVGWAGSSQQGCVSSLELHGGFQPPVTGHHGRGVRRAIWVLSTSRKVLQLTSRWSFSAAAGQRGRKGPEGRGAKDKFKGASVAIPQSIMRNLG